MIDSSPRPLRRHRLEKLVHGLRQRMSSSVQKMSAEVAVLTEDISRLEAAHGQSIDGALAEQKSQLDISTTDWDEAIHDGWDAAELRSYRAVFETAEQEGSLRKEARRQVDHATMEVKRRVADIEQRFLRAKDVPIKRLHSFRQSIQALLEELQQVENAADAALAQRSLSAPKVEAMDWTLEDLKESGAACEQLQSTIATARQHCDRLANHPLARFFESFWWWSICGLIFGAVAIGLTVSHVLPLLSSVLVGAAATVVVLLVGLLGVRPWLKRIAAAEYPKVKNSVALGRKLHELGMRLAIGENDAELKRLANKRDERFEQAKAWREQQIKEISHKLETHLTQIRERAESEKLSASRFLTSKLDETNTVFTGRLEQEQRQAEGHRRSLKDQLDSSCNDIRDKIDRLSSGGALRMQIATQKALQVISRSRRWCNEHFPDWSLLDENRSLWPESLSEPVLPLGNLAIEDILPDSAKRDVGNAQLQAPLLFSPLHDGYLTITGDPGSPAIEQLVRNLVMRALTTLPPGKTQICVIDPPGLGRDFGWLMHLSDFDPQLVSHRVWTQPGHIAKQLSALALAAEDFIQQSLRNEYQNIVQYNRDAGALSEPYRILVWSSMPSGLDDTSWKSLQSLLDTGARCGIIPILLIDPQVSWPCPEYEEAVRRRGLHLTLDESRQSFIANSQLILDTPIRPSASAPDEQSQVIIKEVGRRALLSSRVEVPLERMVPAQDERWQGDSSQCLDIPIGQSGVGRMHSLRLGVGTAQHAIIAGKTGSGKSSLLHAMITSAVMKYSPERLRLVLLDFKKGVEFQVYSDSGVPHADIVGIESHREFGLSALEYVDGCMQRRGESFRQAGVQDIASWNALHPDKPIPRLLVVIDEFQELFVEDDKLSGQASLILDRIVRQGRSFGVHAVLSSQTLAGSYSLPRTTLGQMAVRIALQCDASDAQIIFAEDNPAASRLKHPGQAVYNDAGGRIEGNQPMQIGWLAKQQQLEWFGQLPAGYQNTDPSTNRLGRTVVYDGNRAATWNAENADLALERSRKEVNPDAIWCVAGESVSISPAVTFPLTRQAGRNVLVVGANDPQAAAVLDVVTSSLVRVSQAKSHGAAVYVAQGAKPTDARALALPGIWKDLPCELSVADSRGVDGMLKAVHEQLQKRIEDSDSAEEPAAILLNLLQIGRLRSLRREDEFGLGGFGESEMTPDKHLEEILRDGPSHGIHTMIWAESYSTVSRWLSRSAIREIEIRILMQMSANDSTNLVDSVAASRLGDHVMLVYDEATGQEQRFRPFAPETLGELPAWASRS